MVYLWILIRGLLELVWEAVSAADSEDLRAALRADALSCRLSILQLDFLRVFHFDGLLALDTVCLRQISHRPCIVSC